MTRPLSIAAWMAAGVVPSQAQGIDPIHRLFPPEAFSTTIRADQFDDGVRTYTQLVARSATMTIGIDELRLSSMPNGNIRLEMGAITVRPRDDSAPVTSLSGVDLTLHDWPDLESADDLCAWTDVIETARVGLAQMQLPSFPSTISSVRAQGLSFEARGQGESCWLAGTASVDTADVYRQDGSSLGISQLAFDASAPVSRASAAQSSTQSGVRSRLGELEVRNAGGTLAYALSRADVRADIETASLEGMLHVLRTAVFAGVEANASLNGMQIANALTLVEGRISAWAPVMRIYTAGVVPSEVVANFSRVGLSTVTGQGGVEFEMERGRILARLRSSLTGLIDLDGEAFVTIAPYPMAKLQAANAGQELGAHLIPDARVTSAELTYTDRGFEGYVRDLTGVPSGRYIQEFGAVLAEQHRESVRFSILEAARSMSGFFRFAAEQRPMVISVSPEAAVSLAQIALVALTNLRGLSDLLNVEVMQLEVENPD